MEVLQPKLPANSLAPKQSDHNWSFCFLCLIFFAAVGLDQAAKHFVTRKFLNYNFAFSLPLPVWLMYVIYVLALGGISYYLFKNYYRQNFLAKISWTLILAGGLCNIVERIFLGYVRDFIFVKFYSWTGIYNLADFYIILGIVILLLPKGSKN